MLSRKVRLRFLADRLITDPAKYGVVALRGWHVGSTIRVIYTHPGPADTITPAWKIGNTVGLDDVTAALAVNGYGNLTAVAPCKANARCDVVLNYVGDKTLLRQIASGGLVYFGMSPQTNLPSYIDLLLLVDAVAVEDLSSS